MRSQPAPRWSKQLARETAWMVLQLCLLKAPEDPLPDANEVYALGDAKERGNDQCPAARTLQEGGRPLLSPEFPGEGRARVRPAAGSAGAPPPLAFVRLSFGKGCHSSSNEVPGVWEPRLPGCVCGSAGSSWVQPQSVGGTQRGKRNQNQRNRARCGCKGDRLSPGTVCDATVAVLAQAFLEGLNSCFQN